LSMICNGLICLSCRWRADSWTSSRLNGWDCILAVLIKNFACPQIDNRNFVESKMVATVTVVCLSRF
jgi:hypothetical protein